MNSDQAKEIINLVVAAYPKYAQKKNEFDNPKLRVQTLHKKLMERDYSKSMDKVNSYIETSPYEPNLSDLLIEKEKPRVDWQKQMEDEGIRFD